MLTIKSNGGTTRKLTFTPIDNDKIAVGFIKEENAKPLYLHCNPAELLAATKAATEVAKKLR